MVAKLYEATQAGVRVDAIVRGVCRLRPNVKGVSEKMRVVSIIGRFLEHHRVLCFYNNGNPLYFIGSADWMVRNLTRRIELLAPIECPRLKAELKHFLGLCLCDTANSWEMDASGRYENMFWDKNSIFRAIFYFVGNNDVLLFNSMQNANKSSPKCSLRSSKLKQYGV